VLGFFLCHWGLLSFSVSGTFFPWKTWKAGKLVPSGTSCRVVQHGLSQAHYRF
jgi:hypothetical protein